MILIFMNRYSRCPLEVDILYFMSFRRFINVFDASALDMNFRNDGQPDT